MRLTIRENGWLRIGATSSDTYDFATRPGMGWPGSALRSQSCTLDLDTLGDLVDYAGPEDVGSDELGAFQDYALERAIDILTTIRAAHA